MLDNTILPSRWINMTSAAERSSPAPRTHHTAAFVDKALFISGGTGSSGALLDLWRRNNISSTYQPGGEWLFLSEGYHVPLASSGPFKPHGATVLVSPWGILSMGGLAQDRVKERGMDTWVIDPVSKLWRPVTVNDVGMRPVTRYHELSNYFAEYLVVVRIISRYHMSRFPRHPASSLNNEA